MSRIVLLLAAALVVFCAPLSLLAQTGQPSQGLHLPPMVEQGQGMDNIPVKTDDEVNQERLQKLRELRQEELKRDAQKLYQLTGELKEYIDKNNANMLSLDMLKKAETIEKLAKSVRQRMKDNQ
jgi:hypothetical protein